MQDRLFIRHPEEWNHCFNASLMLTGHAQVQTVKNGIVLPPIPIPNSELPWPILDIACKGGVCSESLEFVAGHLRDPNRRPTNLDCAGAYQVDEKDMITRHERVVFGGVLYDHFGHAIIDSLTRLWYAAEHPDFEKLVFVHFPYDGFLHSKYDSMNLIKLFGIPLEKIEIIDTPTRFDEVIVPDEAFHCFSGYLPEFKKPFQDVANKLRSADSPKKVYLSHCAAEQKAIENGESRHVLNEEFFESFFTQRGFEIVYPEQLPLEKQVEIIAGADEIVATIGTLTHLLLFAKESVQATILIRHEPMFVQANIDQALGIEPYYVDVSNNPLPVDHGPGPCLLMPNRFFREYLVERGFSFSEEDLDMSTKLDDLVLQFLRTWATIYRQDGVAGPNVSRHTMFDVIRRMNDVFYGETFDENAYRDADRLHDTERVCDAALHELVAMKESTSWKLTKPVRAAKDLLVSFRRKRQAIRKERHESA